MRNIKCTRHCWADVYTPSIWSLASFCPEWTSAFLHNTCSLQGLKSTQTQPSVWSHPIFEWERTKLYRNKLCCVSRPQVPMQLQRLCCFLYAFPFLVWTNFSLLLVQICWQQHNRKLPILNLVHTLNSAHKRSELPKSLCSPFNSALEYELVHVSMWIALVLRVSGIFSQTVKPFQTSYSHN